MRFVVGFDQCQDGIEFGEDDPTQFHQRCESLFGDHLHHVEGSLHSSYRWCASKPVPIISHIM